MKIISLSILTIVFSVSLLARENPFEPTDHFTEQKKMIMKANELEKIKKEQEATDKMAKELKAKELALQKMADEKAQAKLVEKKQEVKTMPMVKEVKAEKMLAKKPYIPEIKENFKILPFVKIYVVNDVLTIKVDTKYKLLNQDILKPVKKLLFDFKGKESFYTIRKDIMSENFKSLAVGTHMKENFFRVVIDLPYDIIHYTEKVDSKNGIITITKKK